MKRKGKTRPKWLRWVIGAAIGLAIYLLLSLLTADLILQEKLPEEAGNYGLCLSAALSGGAMGAICGRGGNGVFSGLAAGGICAMMILLAKGICNTGAQWTVYTSAAVALCLISAMCFSCIFHKRNKSSTKRVKRKTSIK
ncbi:MAG: hypothetical protein IJ112_02330 [Oscillospiraceae bacterium]|nr:hypothetical protein [Oscillospiraceae bacterium]